jgi:putative ABC transport system ATP-binding protein
MGEIEVPALRGFTLDVNKGEFLAVMGASGSGKSTAMNMIGALDIPTKGTIKIEGKNITQFTESQLATYRGQKIGFIFQKFNLVPSLTTLQNVTLPMIFQGKSKEERIKTGSAILESIGLKERMDFYPLKLSGGEQQRVAIARALANDPDIVLADEPTGNLDSQTGKLVMDVLKDLHKKKKKTIVLITHDRNVAKYAERIVKIVDGAVVK